MRTPCDGKAELWTSELAEDRAIAIEACGHCPRRLACHADAVEGRESWGVWGGVDFSTNKPGTRLGAVGVCTNRECNAQLTYDGTRRRYCNPSCRARESYLRQKGKAA